MFIKSNIFFILIVGFLYSFTNFFYEDDDWYILKNPGQIQSITDDNYRVIVGARNGLFTYDKVTHELLYDISLMRGLPSDIIKHVYYDDNTDHIWVIHSGGVSFKPLSSFSYHHLSNSDLIDKGISTIDDIGSSSGYIWLRNYQYIVPLNPFSGKFVDINDALNEKNDINWGSSMYGFDGQNIDISKFYIPEPEWSIGYRVNNMNSQYLDHNVFFDKHGDQIIPTVSFVDSDNNYWIGTDRGFLFYAWGNSRKLDPIQPILKKGIISDAYLDRDRNWWFFDSEFKRTGYFKNQSFDYFNGDDDIFLIFWDEDSGNWERFNIDESVSIKNTDVNDVVRIDDYLLVATGSGLLKKNLNNSSISKSSSNQNNTSGLWDILDSSNGLGDDVVWKVVDYNGKIIAMTSNSLNEINLNPFKVIINDFKDNNNLKIYDMDIYGDDLLVATSKGIKKTDLSFSNSTLVSNKVCYQVEIEGESLYCLNNSISRLKLSSTNFKELIFDNQIRNFEVCDNYIWINLIDRARLVDMNSGESWYYNQDDGIQGREIFNIGCEDDWVWFVSDKGVSLFNWEKYHDN